MPWIILTVISLIFDVIQIIGNMVNADHAAWVGGLFFFAIGCYIFIVVWSHRCFDQNCSRITLIIYIHVLDGKILILKYSTGSSFKRT